MTTDTNGARTGRPVCVVSGAGGLVGRHLLPLMAEWDVIAIVRQPGDALPWVRYHVHDLTDVSALDALPAHADAVIHLAQSRRFREFPEGAADVLAVNVAATERLARYAAQAGARHFVLTSSGGVYAPSSAAFSEDAPLSTPQLAGWYQASKLAAEAIAHAHRGALVPVVLRPFFVYGSGQQRQMLMPRLWDTIRRNDVVQLAGPDGMYFSPTHANDAARAVLRALQLTEPATINVRGPEVVSLRTVCEMIGQQLQIKPQFMCSPSAGPSYVADAQRMERLLGVATCHFADHVASIGP